MQKIGAYQKDPGVSKEAPLNITKRGTAASLKLWYKLAHHHQSDGTDLIFFTGTAATWMVTTQAAATTRARSIQRMRDSPVEGPEGKKVGRLMVAMVIAVKFASFQLTNGLEISAQETKDQVLIEFLKWLIHVTFFPEPPSPADRASVKYLRSGSGLKIYSLSETGVTLEISGAARKQNFDLICGQSRSPGRTIAPKASSVAVWIAIIPFVAKHISNKVAGLKARSREEGASLC